MAAPLACPPGVLGERGGVGVVLQLHRKLEFFFQQSLQRHGGPVWQVRRRINNPPLGAYRPPKGNAERLRLSRCNRRLSADLTEQITKKRHRMLPGPLGSRTKHPSQNGSLFIADDGGGFGPANIQAKQYMVMTWLPVSSLRTDHI